MGLVSDGRGDGGQLLRRYPAADVLVPTPREKCVQHVFAMVVEDGGVVTEIVYNDQNVEEALVALHLLQSNGHFVLLRYDLLQRVVVKFVKRSTSRCPARPTSPELFDQIPAGVDIRR